MDEHPEQEFEHKKTLTVQQKWAIVAECRDHYDWEKRQFKPGGLAILEKKYPVCRKQIFRIFNDYKRQLDMNELFPDLEPKHKTFLTGKRGKLVSRYDVDDRQDV